jgi:hypothetical protein
VLGAAALQDDYGRSPEERYYLRQLLERYGGVPVAKGGLMYEASVGGQKFSYTQKK